MCDVWDEENELAVVIYGEEGKTFEETHRFKIPDGFHWKDVRNVTVDVGRAISDAFREIEKANDEKLRGIVSGSTWTNKNRLPDRLLKDLIEHFSTLTLSLANCPEDELGQGYEYLVRKFADDSGHTAQEFYTNRTVVHLMTEILDPQEQEAIYDPTCGSAGMLISAVAYLREHGREWINARLYGQEINTLTSAIGRMNMFLHGISDFHIVNDDTLARPAFIENGSLQRFDIVLANPPYSIRQWNRKAFETDKYGRNIYGVPPQGRADYAFIQHVIANLKPDTGRCAILLPHGVLFRAEESAIRENLVKSDKIEYIIGLAPNLFYNSPMEACIMICRMDKNPEHRGHILFVNAVDLVERSGVQSWLNYGHRWVIAKTCKNYQTQEGFSRAVSIEEIAENNYSLNIALYVRPPADSKKDTRSLEECISEWDMESTLMCAEYRELKRMLEGRRVDLWRDTDSMRLL